MTLITPGQDRNTTAATAATAANTNTATTTTTTTTTSTTNESRLSIPVNSEASAGPRVH